jgi:hypothetical protein
MQSPPSFAGRTVHLHLGKKTFFVDFYPIPLTNSQYFGYPMALKYDLIVVDEEYPVASHCLQNPLPRGGFAVRSGGMYQLSDIKTGRIIVRRE